MMPPGYDPQQIEEKCTQTTYFDDDEEIDVDYLAAQEGLRIIFPKFQIKADYKVDTFDFDALDE